MITGIYKYQNKINGKIYIGQSQDIERRFQQHLYDAEKRPMESTGIDLAINKYGIENFTFEIIERCRVEELDDKEIFWINFYNSYADGYNQSPGGRVLRGENHPKAILTLEQVWQLREAYKNHIKRSEAFKPFLEQGITERALLKVWNCENWNDIHIDVYTDENKLWHKKQIGNKNQKGLSSLDRAIKQEDIDLWRKEFENGLTINAIAKKYKHDNGTVEKYINNPLCIQKIKYKGRSIKNINTGKIFKSISAAAKWAGCGATTITRHLASDKVAGKVPDTNEPAIWEEIL